MTLRRLKTLVAVADHKTFSGAARAVHITHAAVSQQMQSLEAELGIALFDRTARTPILTPVALEVVTKARRLIAEYDNLVPSVLADGGLKGLLRIGALRTTLTGLTPQAMADLKTRYPKLKLRISPGLTGHLLAEIERGNLDLAMVTKPPLMPSGIVFRELVREPMLLIASLEETLDDPYALLQSRPFIRFDRNAVLGTLIENWLTTQRLRVTETMELDSPEAISSMVQANLGVSIVPLLAVQPREGAMVKRLGLGPNPPSRVLGLAYSENHIKMRAIDEVYSALHKQIAKQNMAPPEAEA